MNTPRRPRIRTLLRRARSARILVLGDLMLDQFIWGRVERISPEAPVPIVAFQNESFMPGGAANVARNLTALGCPARLVSIVGRDPAGRRLRDLLQTQSVDCSGLVLHPGRTTSIKTRIIAHQQQVVRVDREEPGEPDPATERAILRRVKRLLPETDAVILGDYGKGMVTQSLLEHLKPLCRRHAVWLSLDPKPVHSLNLADLSLITPNRKEAFELAQITDSVRHPDPLQDRPLVETAQRLLESLRPALLLITLGELGMLLCRRSHPPLHIPTVAQEVYDVSGAGDTVIASITLALAAGASPAEAAVFSNHAAGVVVGKIGTATVQPRELLDSFPK